VWWAAVAVTNPCQSTLLVGDQIYGLNIFFFNFYYENFQTHHKAEFELVLPFFFWLENITENPNHII
jgi:hypothetical protein